MIFNLDYLKFMDVSVIIVNYKVPDYIYQCVLSLKKALIHYDYEIFVVDNNSQDNSSDFLNKYHKDIIYIQNNDNLGFSRANNIAIKQAKGKYVLIINPDTFVSEDIIDICVDFMNSHEDAAACGVKMFSAQGKYARESKRGIPKVFTAFCKLVGLCTLFPKSKLFGKYYMGHLNENEVCEIEILSGAFMFVRNDAFEKVGVFDEDYFMYGEDIDLSYRFLKAGYKNYFLPIPIIHYKGESTQKISYQYVNNFNKSMIIFFKKHFSIYSWLLEFPILSAVYFKALIGYFKVGLFKLLGLVPSVQDVAYKKKFLVFTNFDDESDDPALKILNKFGYKTDVIHINDDTMKNGHLSLQNNGNDYDFVVYNTSIFSFKDIISYFTKNNKPDDVEVALYHPDINKIITSIQVLEL